MNPQLKRGTLELCVLALLSDRDCYGYELVNAISESIHITEGTIYPLMKRLKDEGWHHLLSCRIKRGSFKKVLFADRHRQKEAVGTDKRIVGFL